MSASLRYRDPDTYAVAAAAPPRHVMRRLTTRAPLFIRCTKTEDKWGGGGGGGGESHQDVMLWLAAEQSIATQWQRPTYERLSQLGCTSDIKTALTKPLCMWALLPEGMLAVDVPQVDDVVELRSTENESLPSQAATITYSSFTGVATQVGTGLFAFRIDSVK
jgi:hypothetical protein